MATEYTLNRIDLVNVLGSEEEVDKLVDAVRVAENKRKSGHPAWGAVELQDQAIAEVPATQPEAAVETEVAPDEA